MDLFDQISDNSLPPLVIAELSGNHGGDLSKALDLIDAAVESGADAIKLQTYKPETITVRGKDDRFLLKDGLWAGQYLHDLYNDAMTPGIGTIHFLKKLKDLVLSCLVHRLMRLRLIS